MLVLVGEKSVSENQCSAVDRISLHKPMSMPNDMKWGLRLDRLEVFKTCKPDLQLFGHDVSRGFCKVFMTGQSQTSSDMF